MSTILDVQRTPPREITVQRQTPSRMIVTKDKGPRGDPGALTPSTLAARPAASSVPAGTLHYATDSSTPLAISTGSSWVTPPSTSPLVTRVTDTTNGLTTVIEALTTAYRVGGLETADVSWPGGTARVTVTGLAESDDGHVMGPSDTLQIQQSTDAGATWDSIEPIVGVVKNVFGYAWMPEVPVSAEVDGLTVGQPVRFRLTVFRLFAGTVPVTVPWYGSARSLTVESLR